MIIYMIMGTQRFTITLPDDVGKLVRKKARDQKKPVSRVIAEAIEASERERIRQEMIRGYKESAALNKQLAEEWMPISLETWPDD
jgi:predicted transcriptional regulator